MNELIKITNENGTPVVSSRDVAESFGKQHKHVLDAVSSYEKDVPNFRQMFLEIEIPDSYNRLQRAYQMTRDGFSLLAMGFTGKEALAWKLKYIEAFNRMEQQLAANNQALSPQLQVLINLELQQKEQAQAIAQANQRIDDICDVVALNPTAWREDARHLISKIATKWGGYEYIKEVNAEIFRLVDARGGVSLATRLTNKRQRMAEEGVCKSKREKLTKVDIIAEDKKLVEIYLAIVKEMAIQNGVAQKSA